MDAYIARRCEMDGVTDGGEVCAYTGARIDWAPLDRFDERQRQTQERRQQRQQRAEAASVEVEKVEEEKVAREVEVEEEAEVAREAEVDEEEEDAPLERRRWRDRLRGVVVSTREILSRSSSKV